MLKPNRLVGVVVRDMVMSGGKGGSRGGCGVCIPPPAIFKHVFNEHNISIILNLFDNNKTDALSTY